MINTIRKLAQSLTTWLHSLWSPSFQIIHVHWDTGNGEGIKAESSPSLLAGGVSGADRPPAHERALINKITSAVVRPFLPGPCWDTLQCRAPKIHDLHTKPCLLRRWQAHTVGPSLMLHLPTEHLKGVSHRHSNARAFLFYFNPIMESFYGNLLLEHI